jgi:hypothetical protein
MGNISILELAFWFMDFKKGVFGQSFKVKYTVAGRYPLGNN